MKPSDELFKLIKSLTKPEKRFFKIHAVSGVQEKKKNSSILFDLLDKQENYDENIIKKKLENSSILRNLSYEKNYLHRLILRSLRMYHDEISVNAKLENHLRNIEILYKKRLFDSCEKQHDKALDLAREYEAYWAVIQLIDWQYKLHSRFERYDKLTSFSLEGLKEKSMCLERIKHLSLAEKITYEVIGIDRLIGTAQDEKSRNRLGSLFNEAVELRPLLTGNFFAEELTLTALYYISYLSGEYNDALNYNSQVVDLFESKPQFKKERVARYYSHQINLIRRLLELKQYGKVEDHVAQIKKFIDSVEPIISKEISPEMIMVLFIYELEYLGDTGQLDNALKIIKEFFVNEGEGSNTKEASLLFSAYVNILRIFYLSGDYKNAQALIKKLLFKEHITKDVNQYAFIIRILIASDLNKKDQITFLINEGRKLFADDRQNLELIESLFSFIVKESRSQKENEIIILRDKISCCNTDHKYWNLVSLWLESKLYGKPIKDILCSRL